MQLKLKITFHTLLIGGGESLARWNIGADPQGFTGTFQVNFYIPDLLGIGKGSSRGYGCCLDVTGS